MAGGAGEARFAGLSLVQLNELLEDEGQLAEMVQKMEEVGAGQRLWGLAGCARQAVARGGGDRGARAVSRGPAGCDGALGGVRDRWPRRGLRRQCALESAFEGRRLAKGPENGPGSR